LADDAVDGEPVSEDKFPANRENNREFSDFGPFFRAIVLKIARNSGGYERIPYAAEQGNNSLDLGMFSREQGISAVAALAVNAEVFSALARPSRGFSSLSIPLKS
jgi:hypothetical protein